MTKRSETEELVEALDSEFWFDRESRNYKMTRGSSGMQINAEECPTCGDRRSRTYLNAETGRGNCFVCSQTFSKISFIHHALGHDPEDKRHWAATFKHIKDVLTEQGWRPRKRVETAVFDRPAQMPESIELPTETGWNLEYLEQRGLTGEIAKYFHLRYCKTGRWTFTKDDGSEGWQRFDGRVIIPVYDLDGQFVTYQGRDVTGLAGDQKYLFPKGLPGTGRYLLNGDSVHHAKRLCMGEGFFDVAAIKIAFDEEPSLRDVGVIGSFGKHLSGEAVNGDDQISRLVELRRAGLEELTIMWDGEWRALDAAVEAAERLERLGIVTRIALLPPGRDPNEVTADVVRAAFWKAQRYSVSLALKFRLRNPYKHL